MLVLVVHKNRFCACGRESGCARATTLGIMQIATTITGRLLERRKRYNIDVGFLEAPPRSSVLCFSSTANQALLFWKAARSQAASSCSAPYIRESKRNRGERRRWLSRSSSCRLLFDEHGRDCVPDLPFPTTGNQAENRARVHHQVHRPSLRRPPNRLRRNWAAHARTKSR